MNTRRRIVDSCRLPLIGLLFATCQFVCGQTLPNDAAELSNLAGRNQDMLRRDLLPVLKAMDSAGRVYVQSSCLGAAEDMLFFPRIEVKAGANGKSGATAIQEALAMNKNVRVAERQPGVIGIWIGDVSHDLLRTKIHLLKLGPRQRYNYTDAIAAIIDTREVQTKMREARMEGVPEFAIYPIVAPDPKLPHLPGSMTDVTVDEALDQVARTFRGLVIYWECKGQNSTRSFSVLMREM